MLNLHRHQAGRFYAVRLRSNERLSRFHTFHFTIFTHRSDRLIAGRPLHRPALSGNGSPKLNRLSDIYACRMLIEPDRSSCRRRFFLFHCDLTGCRLPIHSSGNRRLSHFLCRDPARAVHRGDRSPGALPSWLSSLRRSPVRSAYSFLPHTE